MGNCGLVGHTTGGDASNIDPFMLLHRLRSNHKLNKRTTVGTSAVESLTSTEDSHRCNGSQPPPPPPPQSQASVSPTAHKSLSCPGIWGNKLTTRKTCHNNIPNLFKALR